jgi:hypothetical protein
VLLGFGLDRFAGPRPSLSAADSTDSQAGRR